VVVAHENSGTLEVIARGFAEGDGGLLDEARTAAEQALRDAVGSRLDELELSRALQAAVEDVVRHRSRRSPLVVPVVLGN
jgi:Arc/MetJ family transcription regulator